MASQVQVVWLHKQTNNKRGQFSQTFGCLDKTRLHKFPTNTVKKNEEHNTGLSHAQPSISMLPVLEADLGRWQWAVVARSGRQHPGKQSPYAGEVVVFFPRQLCSSKNDDGHNCTIKMVI
jgi:hypothetical protein